MSQGPLWHTDVETAAKECRETLDQWQSQVSRVRELVEQHETYAPEAFKASVEGLLPEFRRATLAAVSRLQILTQIKSGEMRFRGDEPEESRG